MEEPGRVFEAGLGVGVFGLLAVVRPNWIESPTNAESACSTDPELAR